MNHSEMLKKIKECGIAHQTIADVFGVKRQSLDNIINQTNKDPLKERPDRVDSLRHYLKQRGHVQALAILHTYLRENQPRNVSPDRELYELSETPCTHLYVLLPTNDTYWLEHVLPIISNDGRATGNMRTIYFIFGNEKQPHDRLWREINYICKQKAPLRFNAKSAYITLPEGFPPSLFVDNKMLQFGDEGLIPCSSMLADYWQPMLPSNVTALDYQPLGNNPIDSYWDGSQQPAADDGKTYTVICDHGGGKTTTLKLIAIGDSNWMLTVSCLGIDDYQRLKVVDNAGHHWVNAEGQYLPWQGFWPYGDCDPSLYLDGLRFVLQE